MYHSRSGIPNYDQFLRITKGREAYHLDKVKAGAMGGAVSKPNILACKRNAKGASYSRLKAPVDRMFLCIKSIGSYEQGRTYEIRVGGLIPFGLKSWSEFLTYFSERKVLK